MADALVAARLVHFAAVMLAFGSLAFRVYALGGVDAAAALAAFDAWLGRVVAGAALVALLSAAAVLACIAAGMAGTAAAAIDPGTIAAVLTDTRFGHVWCGHLAAAIVLVAASCRGGRALPLAAAAILLASLGWVGHAAMAPGIGHQINQTLHLLAGGLWLGGLVPLGWLARQARRHPVAIWQDTLREALPPFSRMGYGAVAVLALTGTINTAWLVGSVDALFTTPYGRLLTLKIALFLAMVGVALGNHLRRAPRFASGAAPVDALARAIAVEQALGLAILAAVSLLGTWPPAMHGAM